MRVLVINCGSSTLKFELIEAADQGTGEVRQLKLAGGTVDRIGQRGMVNFRGVGVQSFLEGGRVSDHAQASRKVLDWLGSSGALASRRLEAVGHRVVHGGDRFREPTLIDEDVIAAIEEVTQLAPLHNEPSLQAIRAVREALDPSVPMVAVFDTAFHRSLPERAARYAISPDLADRHQIQRYGFHGIAHRYMVERYAAITSRPLPETRLITLQLGNGCSAAAVAGGRSVDTSMGLTPLEGLVMGTRSGDVDPSLVSFLASREDVTAEEVESWLNTRSGLLGVSGRSQDMRELLEAEQQSDARASLALEMFCYRARKYIGAYLAVLGGADAVVFGGGIGENSPAVRERICAGMEWCGLRLDPGRNAGVVGEEAPISTDGAGIEVYVIRVDEAALIARDTVRCLRSVPGR